MKDSTDAPKENLEDNVALSTIESKGESSPEATSKGQSKEENSPEATSKGQSNRSKIIKLLSKDGEVTLPMVAASLNLSLAGVEKIVRQLKAEGILSRKGSTKAGEWIVTNTKIQQ